jgi:hypothetical protein
VGDMWSRGSMPLGSKKRQVDGCVCVCVCVCVICMYRFCVYSHKCYVCMYAHLCAANTH